MDRNDCSHGGPHIASVTRRHASAMLAVSWQPPGLAGRSATPRQTVRERKARHVKAFATHSSVSATRSSRRATSTAKRFSYSPSLPHHATKPLPFDYGPR